MFKDGQKEKYWAVTGGAGLNEQELKYSEAEGVQQRPHKR